MIMNKLINFFCTTHSNKIAGLLALLCLYSVTVTAQRIVIPLTSEYGNSNTFSDFKFTEKIIDTKKYKLKNRDQYKSWQLRSLVLRQIQQYKEYVLTGKWDDARFKKFSTATKLDTSNVVNKFIRNSVATQVGIDSSGKRYFTVDVNNNLDFNDDSTYAFEKEKKNYELGPIVKPVFDFFDGHQVRETVQPFTIDGYAGDGYLSDGDKNDELDAVFYDQAYRQGFYRENGNAYVIHITNKGRDLFRVNDFNLNIRRVPVDSTVNFKYAYRQNSLIDFNGKDMYKIDSVTRDSLYLSFQFRADYDGGKINSKAPAIIENDYISSKQFSLQAQKGSYVVIDFWGTWCRPCMEALPDLIALRNKYRRKGVKVLSLAYDKTDDIPKLNSIIQQKGLDWSHVLIDKKGEKKILEDYKVQAFPSIFLIDPNGMVVIRGEGKVVTQKIDHYLETALK